MRLSVTTRSTSFYKLIHITTNYISKFTNDYHSTIRVKDVVEVDNLYDKKLKINSAPSALEMQFNEIAKEPFVFKSIAWTTTTPVGELARVTLPQDLLINDLIQTPFSFSSYYYMDMCVLIQTAGTMKHQGCLLVAAVPTSTPTITNINEILSAPHAFLNANEANPICVPCPFYINGNVAQSSLALTGNINKTLARQPAAFCELIFYVLNPLAASTGSSTSLSISLSAQVKQCKFYGPNNRKTTWVAQSLFEKQGLVEEVLNVPTMILDTAANGLKGVVGDIIDLGRASIKNLTGFHNPNDPAIENRVITTRRNFQNNVDSKVCLEVLDNHSKFSRIYDDYYFRTEVDEMNLTHLLSKPVYIGSFNVDTNTTRGTNLMAYPITPMVEIKRSGAGFSDSYCSIMRLLYESSRTWRGGLKLHIQAVCTSFHFTKLCVVKVYSPGRQALSVSNQVMQYNDVINMPTDVIEFSNGGQIQTIDLPYCSDTKQLDCTKDYTYNAINHGIVYIYLETPLAISEGVPSSMNFNVYLSGAEDLEFSGYAVDLIDRVIEPTVFLNEIAQEEPIKRVMTKQSAKVVSLVSNQDSILNDKSDIDSPLNMSFQPNVSLRDYLRIMQPLDIYHNTSTEVDAIYQYNVAAMLFGTKDAYKTSNQALMRHFMGISGGVKIRFKITGCANARISYLPPSTMAIDSGYPNVYPTNGISPNSVTTLHIEWSKSIGFQPDASFTNPHVDGAEYIYSDSSIAAHSPNLSATVYQNIVILEAAIPNMNLNNFAGTAQKWLYDDAHQRSVMDDLGQIYIHVRAIASTDTPIPISIVPYIGIGDEARVGFQVYNPIKKVSNVINEGKKYRLTHFTPSEFIKTIMPGLVLSPSDHATACYYFKT